MNLTRERSATGQVILVEDDPGVRGVVALLLESEGWSVLTAEDASTGLTHASNTRPDLLVTDLRLPGMSGIDLAERIRSSAGLDDVPLVAITSDTSGIRDSAERSGLFFAVLAKPLEPTLFLETVRAALQSGTDG